MYEEKLLCSGTRVSLLYLFDRVVSEWGLICDERIDSHQIMHTYAPQLLLRESLVGR